MRRPFGRRTGGLVAAPDRSEGLYAAWRRLAESDLAWSFAGLSGWRAALARWPEQPLDAIVAELRRLGLPESRWEAYLTRLALELPGWSGMMNWRQQHGAYPANQETPVALADYLALRLCLDGLWIEQLCHEHWGLEGSLPALRDYFTARPAEALVRQALYEGRCPNIWPAGRGRWWREEWLSPLTALPRGEQGAEGVKRATRALGYPRRHDLDLAA